MASRTVRKMITVPLAGFSNPRYIADNPTDNMGFEIDNATAVAIYFSTTISSMTVVAEQTFDNTGAAEWFAVAGKALNDVNGALLSSVSQTQKGQTFIYPAIGTRMRFRVSALSGADLAASIGFITGAVDLATTGQLSAGTNLIGAGAPSASATVGTGTTHAKVKSAASTNLTSVKASAGKLFRYTFRNNTASAKFAKLFNKASAPVLGTDTPIETVIIPANGVATYLNPIGKAFSTGIAYAITGGIGESDATATAVDDVVGSLDYI